MQALRLLKYKHMTNSVNFSISYPIKGPPQDQKKHVTAFSVQTQNDIKKGLGMSIFSLT